MVKCLSSGRVSVLTTHQAGWPYIEGPSNASRKLPDVKAPMSLFPATEDAEVRP